MNVPGKQAVSLEEFYRMQAGVWKETGMACSRVLDGFSVDVEQLFRP